MARRAILESEREVARHIALGWRLSPARSWRDVSTFAEQCFMSAKSSTEGFRARGTRLLVLNSAQRISLGPSPFLGAHRGAPVSVGPRWGPETRGAPVGPRFPFFQAHRENPLHSVGPRWGPVFRGAPVGPQTRGCGGAPKPGGPRGAPNPGVPGGPKTRGAPVGPRKELPGGPRWGPRGGPGGAPLHGGAPWGPDSRGAPVGPPGGPRWGPDLPDPRGAPVGPPGGPRWGPDFPDSRGAPVGPPGGPRWGPDSRGAPWGPSGAPRKSGVISEHSGGGASCQKLHGVESDKQTFENVTWVLAQRSGLWPDGRRHRPPRRRVFDDRSRGDDAGWRGQLAAKLETAAQPDRLAAWQHGVTAWRDGGTVEQMAAWRRQPSHAPSHPRPLPHSNQMEMALRTELC
eukprot:gene16915-biopygen8048